MTSLQNKKFYKAGNSNLNNCKNFYVKKENNTWFFKKMSILDIVKEYIKYLIEKIQFKFFIPDSLIKIIKKN